MNMDFNEIVRALDLIREICSRADDSCVDCPFDSNGECGIQNNGNPAYWIINEVDCWRAFK